MPYQFLNRGIIGAEDRAEFERLVARILALRNSLLIEILLLVVAFTVPWLWTGNLAMDVDSWFAGKIIAPSYFTKAGYWYALVSLPIFRFILVRWYFRIFLWYCFLWRVRRFPLHLNLFHPDRAGGLGFLTGGALAFAPVLLAQTLLVAAMIESRILHVGARLTDFKIDIVTVVFFLLLLVLAPLTFFVVHLEEAERKAKREYGVLASRYVTDFHRKWIEGRSHDGEPLLGTPDIQSLSDLDNAYGTISKIRLVPLGKETVARLAFVIIVPFLPLTLTMVPLEEVITRLAKFIF